ncbi:MAG: hypothetical protein PHQ14_00985 [Chromatiales bacterium]|jgi:hypothetical protein|nr:hypothetical protein [Chromatiales bacterium]MDX9766036.1 hypothetical protein [Ectothiorhodospiraceae bacterium]
MHGKRQAGASTLELIPGRCYSNGLYGNHWVVRQVDRVVDGAMVDFRVVVGAGRRSRGTCSVEEFLRWAQHEVCRNENSWQRV